MKIKLTMPAQGVATNTAGERLGTIYQAPDYAAMQKSNLIANRGNSVLQIDIVAPVGAVLHFHEEVLFSGDSSPPWRKHLKVLYNNRLLVVFLLSAEADYQGFS